MAISVEDISKTIAGDGGEITDAVKGMAEKLFDMFDKDISGLKNTNIQLKNEKTELHDKWKADQEKFAEAEKTLQEQLVAAQEQLKNHDPEQSKKYYDGQVEILRQRYDGQLAEKDKLIAVKDAQIKGYERQALFNEMERVFLRAAEKANVKPGLYSILENAVLGESGRNFVPVDVDGKGRTFLAADKSGNDIATALEKLLATPDGKSFVNFNSSGSGAEGGRPGGSAGSKTITVAEFNKLPPDQRTKYASGGWTIVD